MAAPPPVGELIAEMSMQLSQIRHMWHVQDMLATERRKIEACFQNASFAGVDLIAKPSMDFHPEHWSRDLSARQVARVPTPSRAAAGLSAPAPSCALPWVERLREKAHLVQSCFRAEQDPYAVSPARCFAALEERGKAIPTLQLPARPLMQAPPAPPAPVPAPALAQPDADVVMEVPAPPPPPVRAARPAEQAAAPEFLSVQLQPGEVCSRTVDQAAVPAFMSVQLHPGPPVPARAPAQSAVPSWVAKPPLTKMVEAPKRPVAVQKRVSDNSEEGQSSQPRRVQDMVRKFETKPRIQSGSGVAAGAASATPATAPVEPAEPAATLQAEPAATPVEPAATTTPAAPPVLAAVEQPSSQAVAATAEPVSEAPAVAEPQQLQTQPEAKSRSRAHRRSATFAPPPPPPPPQQEVVASPAAASCVDHPLLTSPRKRAAGSPTEPWHVLRRLQLPDKLLEDNYELSDQGSTSDQDDNAEAERRSKKHVPSWCDNYLNDLSMQANMDPDTVFGSRVPQCLLEQVFPDELYRQLEKHRPKRPRGSSGNWQKDGLTEDEVCAYKRKMGQTKDWRQLDRVPDRTRQFMQGLEDVKF